MCIDMVGYANPNGVNRDGMSLTIEVEIHFGVGRRQCATRLGGGRRRLDVVQVDVKCRVEIEVGAVVLVEEIGVEEHGKVRVGLVNFVGDDGVEVGDVRGDVWPATAVVSGH